MNKILKYQQAKYAIFDLVARGQIKVGERLPSIRKMDKMFPFSVICLNRALDELEQQGYVVKRQGSGIFLARSIDTWERRGAMLLLQIEPGATAAPRDVSALRRYLRDRYIWLDTMAADKPGKPALDASRDCVGVFVSGLVTGEWTTFLAALDKPVLYVGLNKATIGKPSVGFDWKAAVRMAMDRLVAAGRRRIALVNGDRIRYPSRLIADEFLACSRSYELPVGKEDVLWKRGDDAAQAGEFFAGREPYDAILVENGGLRDLLICSWQTSLIPRSATMAVIGAPGDSVSSERIFFLGFRGDIYRYAGEVFSESLNARDYFKNGPKLLEPYFI